MTSIGENVDCKNSVFLFLKFTERVYVNRRKRELARREARKAWIIARAFRFLARSRLSLKRPRDAMTYN